MKEELKDQISDILPHAVELLEELSGGIEDARAIYGDKVEDGYITCKVCGSKMSHKAVKIVKDLDFNNHYVDYICDSCLKESNSRNMVPLVCIKCHQVIMRIPSDFKFSDGFKLIPGKVYHVPCCPECDPTSVSDKQEKPIYILEYLHFLSKANPKRLSEILTKLNNIKGVKNNHE